MNYLSETGLQLLNETINNKQLPTGANYQLQMDVNGESIFMSEDYLTETVCILEATGVMSTIKFSIHCNERTLGVTLNPLEHLDLEVSRAIISSITRKLINVQINDNSVVNSREYEEMYIRTLQQTAQFFQVTNNLDTRISVNPVY